MPAVAERNTKNVDTRGACAFSSRSPGGFSTMAELSRLLEEGMSDIRNGQVYTEAEMDAALEQM
jgi:hypothetical protein